LTFRPATEADWPTIWPIFQQVIVAADTYCYDPSMSSETAMASWLPSGLDETWLVEHDGRVVGTYHLPPNQSGPGAHIANASYMVASDVRGLGVGRGMVEHSIERARARGYRGIQFNAVAETNVHAIKLYESLGFTTVGRVPGAFLHPEHGYVDLLIMFFEL